MAGIKEDLIIEIGKVIMRAAKNTSDNWEYAGYVFAAKNGSVEMVDFLFGPDRKRMFLEDREWFKPLRENFKRFREVTRVEGDDYWIKCKAVLRRDGDFKMLFEFDDWSRWSITPGNVGRAYEILIGDIYPEALEAD